MWWAHRYEEPRRVHNLAVLLHDKLQNVHKQFQTTMYMPHVPVQMNLELKPDWNPWDTTRGLINWWCWWSTYINAVPCNTFIKVYFSLSLCAIGLSVMFPIHWHASKLNFSTCYNSSHYSLNTLSNRFWPWDHRTICDNWWCKSLHLYS